jgi:methionyl-tRNA synthetase
METGIPADVWRFYIYYNRPEKSDALFTWKDFQEKVNGELIGNLGNLVNRTLSFVTRYYDGAIPAGSPDPRFWETVKGFEDRVAASLEKADLRDAFHLIFELSSFANKTFQDGEPWRRRKEDPGDPHGPAAAAALIRDLSYVVRDLAVMIAPYMPQAAEQIAGFFGLSFGKDLVYKKAGGLLSWDSIGRAEGIDRVVKSEVLFAKLEDDKIAELRERYSGSQQERRKEEAAAAPVAPPVSVEEAVPAEPSSPAEPVNVRCARTLDLRVAQIVKIERHPKADKLYIETLEIGQGEERVIVSGLVPFYKEEELLNKRIIVAYNLKPAKLRGVESRGMLLAASDHNGPAGEDGKGTERVEVLDAGSAPTGTRVGIEDTEAIEETEAIEDAGPAGPETPPAEIDIDAFFSVPLEVTDGIVTAGGKALLLDGKPIRTAVIVKGEVH